MVLLTNKMRTEIRRRFIDEVELARLVALRAMEHATAIKLLKHRYGDDVFTKCRSFPDGWFRLIKTLDLNHSFMQSLPASKQEYIERRRLAVHYHYLSHVSLSDYAPLPYQASQGWDRSTIGDCYQDVHDLAMSFANFKDDINNLKAQIWATLQAFSTVEKLCDGWPEGYAKLPAEMLIVKGGLPATRIDDLNTAIEKCRQVA